MPTLREGWQGRFFEDFEIGDVYRCRYGRTVTEADNIQFTLMTNNTNQIHFNHEYAKQTEWGQCLVNSLLTLSIVVGMGVMDVSEHGFALGWDRVRFPKPVFPGDTLYAENEVLESRASTSRPGQGIVKFASRGYNQRGDTVVEFDRSVMVWYKEHAPNGSNLPVPNS